MILNVEIFGRSRQFEQRISQLTAGEAYAQAKGRWARGAGRMRVFGLFYS